MHSSSFVLFLGLAFMAMPALPDERFLQGKLVFVDDQGVQTPAAGLEIVCEETGRSDTTNADGLFKVLLPDALLPGDRIPLQVQRTHWRIWQPPSGEVTIPAGPHDKKPVTLELLEAGAKPLLNEAAIERLLLDAARKSKEQVKADGRPAQIQLSRYIGEWAAQYGFAAQEVEAQVDRWIATPEAQGDGLRRLALAQFAKTNFARAGDLAARWAAYEDRSRHEVEKGRQSRRADAVHAYRLAGDARYDEYRFDDALEFYRKALAVSSRKQSPTTWAAAQDDLGKAARELGVRARGRAARQYLDESIRAHRAALQVRTRDLPQQWAESQNGLGLALQEQGSRARGEAARALLGQAMDAYRAALEVYTRQRTPQQWAVIQTNLGAALQEQGSRSAGEAGPALLAQAVEAYRAALQVFTRERTTQQFAVIQNNLGTALEEQADRSPDETGQALRAEAAAAYSAAVEASTQTSPWLLQHHTDYEPTAGF